MTDFVKNKYYQYYIDVFVRLEILDVKKVLTKAEQEEVLTYMKQKIEDIKIKEAAEGNGTDYVVQMIESHVTHYDWEIHYESPKPSFWQGLFAPKPKPEPVRRRYSYEELARIVDTWSEYYQWLVMQPDMWDIPLENGQDRTSAIIEKMKTSESPILRYAMRQHILETLELNKRLGRY